MSHPRILFITNTNPYSLQFGATQRSTALLKALLGTGASIDVAYVGIPEELPKHKIRNEKIIFWNKDAKFKESIWGHIVRKLTIRYYPRYYNISQPVQHLIEKGHYDLIVARYIRTVYMCDIKKYHQKMLVDLDDYPLVEVLKASKNSTDFFHKLYSRLMKYRAKKEISGIMLHMKKCFLANIEDARKYHTGFLPNISLHRTQSCRFVNTHHNLLFIGKLSYSPNLEGITYFIERILPEITKTRPNVKLIIAGAGLPDSKRKEWESIRNIEYCGFVEDIKDFYSKGNIVVSPIYSGSGTNIKSIEALSMGKATVMTPFSAKGISTELSNKVNCIIANNDAEMIDGIIELLRDVEACQSIQKNGLELAQRLYSIDSLTNMLNDVIYGNKN